MARPTKQTIEAFPHSVALEDPLYIIEERFGNDGYAFWFKLREVLGAAAGLVYDCRPTVQWLKLCARARVGEDKALEILEVLATLDVIDRELWDRGLIWCQDLV